MLSLLFVLAPFIVVACWALILFTGMGEVGPSWLPMLFAAGLVLAAGFFVLYGLGLVVGLVEFDPIINLEVSDG